ncbi:O-antigen ligase family protein [Amnibacterium soli]|uniref:O-antigen ligase family protein n=1 Tax=Amnibacterium soli TaxID=1282736 RepID=A0ABP8ZDW5_9MICO
MTDTDFDPRAPARRATAAIPVRSDHVGSLDAARSRPSRIARSVFAVLLCACLITYSLVWARVVVGGVAIPAQRVLVAVTVVAGIADAICTRGRPPRRVLVLAGLSVLWLGWLVVSLVVRSATPDFQLNPAVMDLSKYAVALGIAIVFAYAVAAAVVGPRTIATMLIVSCAVTVVICVLCLVLYWVGFRLQDDSVLKTFGAAWGVWPTSGPIPRVVGPATEPQQLSVLFVTGLLLAVGRRGYGYILLSAAGLVVLVLSQSKFALLSILVVLAVWLLRLGQRWGLRRRGWTVLGACAALLLVLLGVVASLLPTFQEALKAGLSAGAFTERADNATLLVHAFQTHPVFGIGPGQYGAFRSQQLGIPVDNGYYPNNDYLKVLAETGIPALAMFAAILGVFVWALVRGARSQGIGDGASSTEAANRAGLLFATGVGGVLIAFNMIIGYEMLHVFFWINLGIVVGAAESLQAKRGSLGRARSAGRHRVNAQR